MKLSTTLKIRIEPELKAELASHAAALGYSTAWYARNCLKMAIYRDKLMVGHSARAVQSDGTRPQDGTR
jgi:hypothetical protein